LAISYDKNNNWTHPLSIPPSDVDLVFQCDNQERSEIFSANVL